MKHYCRKPGCFQEVNQLGAYCKQCKKIYKDKPFDGPFYRTTVWRWFRKSYLVHHPLCRRCVELSLVELACEVDHIVPIEDGGSKLSEANVQGLCKRHHSQKTMYDRASRRAKKKISTKSSS